MEKSNLQKERVVEKQSSAVRSLKQESKKQQKIKKFDIDDSAVRLNPEHRQKIKFNIRTGYVFVNPNDIIYCSADSNYTHITFTNQKQLTVSLTLSNVMESLPPSMFLRISRSTIININFLTEIKRTEKLCILNADNKNYSFRISPKNIKALINDFYFDH
jgi:two-component system, LytTR family, response regulator